MKKLLLVSAGTMLLFLSMVFGSVFAGSQFASAKTSRVAVAETVAPDKNCQLFRDSLAQHLGVPASKLQEARLAALGDVLAQMVKDGKLTQSQADQIIQRATKRVPCTGWRAHRFQWMGFEIFIKKYLPSIVDQIATGLHLTRDQFISQLKAGKTLSAIAEAQKVSPADLRTLVINTVNAALTKAVSAGDLTQWQADLAKQWLQNHPFILSHLLKRHAMNQGHTAVPHVEAAQDQPNFEELSQILETL